HLAAAPAARVRACRVLPPDVPVRVVVEPRRLLRPRWLAPAALPRPARRAFFLVYRALLGGPPRHREPAPGQLLGRGLPRRPAREPRRHRRGDHRPRLDSAAGHRLPRGRDARLLIRSPLTWQPGLTWPF